MTLLKKARFRNIVLRALFIIFFFILPSIPSADNIIVVTGIRYWSYPGYTRVVIDLTENIEFTKNRLSSPDRLYFDLQNSRLHEDLKKNLDIENGMLRSIRIGQFSSHTVRIVLDLERIKSYEVFTLETPSRIVIDVKGTKAFSSKKRIVLDPGHGGKDPGAVGRNNLYEKDVVLDVVLKLEKILSDNPNFEIFLTRAKDEFVSLEERTAIANGKNADLFVSIHVNASASKNLKGIETYFLNWTDNEEAMKVAARENQISLKQMKKIRDGMKSDVLTIIKNDLNRDYKRDESMALANYVQNAMVSELDRNYRHIVDLGVKWSFFYVLFGAQMPSVLVEVSFISNPLEAKLLRKDAYRRDLAKSIASGIIQYMSSKPKGQTTARLDRQIAPRN